MQFVAENRLLLAGDFAKVRAICRPIPGRTGDQMKFHDRYRQTVNRAVAIRRQIQEAQHRLLDQLESLHQVASPPIEATL